MKSYQGPRTEHWKVAKFSHSVQIIQHIPSFTSCHISGWTGRAKFKWGEHGAQAQLEVLPHRHRRWSVLLVMTLRHPADTNNQMPWAHRWGRGRPTSCIPDLELFAIWSCHRVFLNDLMPLCKPSWLMFNRPPGAATCVRFSYHHHTSSLGFLSRSALAALKSFHLLLNFEECGEWANDCPCYSFEAESVLSTCLLDLGRPIVRNSTDSLAVRHAITKALEFLRQLLIDPINLIAVPPDLPSER